LFNGEIGRASSKGFSLGRAVKSLLQFPFKVIGHLNFLGNMADYMRSAMVAQSRLDPRNIGHPSIGFRSGGLYRKLFGLGYGGDGVKAGGGRISPYSDKPSPLGGVQGKAGEIFGKPYQPFSFMDAFIESFSGPHDYLNSPFWYDGATGNIRGGMSPFSKALGSVANWANVPLSSVFVIPSVVLPTSKTFSQ